MTMSQFSKLKLTDSSKSVDEEYNKALQSKSFLVIYSKIQDQLNSNTTFTTSTTPSSDPEQHEKMTILRSDDDCFAEFLLEPLQDSLLVTTSSRSGLRLNNLLLDFFDATLLASAACTSLLSSIENARCSHRHIRTLLLNLSSPSTFPKLSAYLVADNPLSPQSLSRFHQMHSRYPMLTQRLTSARRKLTRRIKLVKFAKNASGIAVISLVIAAAAAAVVLATHGAAAVAAAPVALASTANGGLRWPRRWLEGWIGLKGAKARVDAAAKGAYIVERDLDTMSQMLRSVHDEVEHEREMARMVLRNMEWEVVMREVVKQMEGRRGEVGLGLEEHLKELEEHVYLCLTTINRSRRLVVKEMQDASMTP